MSSVFCISVSLVTSCSLRDCVTINFGNECPSDLAFWRVENSVGSFLPADPSTLGLNGRAYELRHILFRFSEISSKESKSTDIPPLPSGQDNTLQPSTVNSSRHSEAVASFRLIWWNQVSGSRKKLSIWRPIVPEGMVYFGDIAVQGYEPPNTCIVLHDSGDGELFKVPIDFQLVGQIRKYRGMDSIAFWLPQAPPGFVSLGCIACKNMPKQSEFSSLRCIRSDMVAGDRFLDESIWDTSDAKFIKQPFSIWTVDNELGNFIVRSGFKKPPRRLALKLADPTIPSGSDDTDDTIIDAEMRTFSAALFDDYGGLMVPLCNISLSNIGFSSHGRPAYLNSSVSFSLVVRSYNDKYESWEPVVEPVDGLLRYQFNLNAPGCASQLRLTSTRDLNLNVSVSNANMILQAYASWSNLSRVHETYLEREAASPTYRGRPIINVHHKRDYYIIPQNKLGQDIYIRATDFRGLQNIIKMPSGDTKPLKVPISKNMLDSHLRGNLCRKLRTMVTIIIAEAELPRVEGLSSHQYVVAVRLTPDQSLPSGSLLVRQSARTCGVSLNNIVSSDLVAVNWNEMFFFKVDSLDKYGVELIVSNIGKGDPVGYFAAPLKQLAGSRGNSYPYNYLTEFNWFQLSPAESMRMTQVHKLSTYGRIRCAALFSPMSEVENSEQSSDGATKSGFIPISPSQEGPWTMGIFTVELPSGWVWHDDWHVDKTPVSTADGWVYAPDLEGLKWPQSYNPLKFVNYARQRRWIRNRRRVTRNVDSQIFVGPLKPGETVPLPLSGLTQIGSYILQLRPSNLTHHNEYSWSSVMDSPCQPDDIDGPKQSSEICVSTLSESEKLLYCSEVSGTSSSSCRGLWFCLTIQAVEIAKGIRSEPIQDWSLVVKPPLSITNYLPLASEFSVLEMQPSGHFLACSREVFSPAETIKVYSADIRNPLCFSLLPQGGWLPIHDAVLISHPSRVPSKTISLRSSISGRIVQIILEHNHNKERPVLAKTVRAYSPYWFAIARCPPLTFRLLNIDGRKPTREVAFPFQSKKNTEIIVDEITEEEIYDGHTIASVLNFKFLGISASITQSGEGHFGPVKDLSPLGDMDGSLDLCAYDADGNCMQLFISSKPCPYPSVPTKVIYVRPFMTFTNRIGQDMFVKLSDEDEPKVLHASDARIFFVYRETGGLNKLQVRLEDTEWSFPVQILKEDTILLVLRRPDGTRKFLKTEIRGYEEGSRFVVVFRLGPTNGPIRIENRTSSKTIRIRQSGSDDDAWIRVEPLSTTIFSWVDPYGQKLIDTEVRSRNGGAVFKLELDKSTSCTLSDGGLGLLFYVLEMGDIKVARFIDERTSNSSSNEESWSLTHIKNWGNSQIQNKVQEKAAPLELIVELGVFGVSVVDHGPKELSYLYLERVVLSYSTGYDGGTTSRFKLILGHLQLDNQLPLTLMPVLLAPEEITDMHHPVFKMTVTMRNENPDGIQVYPYVYIRVTEKCWRLNIHEPIIWALVDFYNNLQLDRIPQSSSVTQVDPELRFDLIDVSEVRLKVSLETAPAQRPHGVLGVWSPILSAVGNAFKIQIHLRKVVHRDRFMRKSSIVPAITKRIWRDLIHNPLHLIFSVDVLGMTSSTLASLSKGFAELSTDGQFLRLRSKQVSSRRITGVGDGIIQGTEALAQGVAFGVSGVVTKPMESARQSGLLGLVHGLGRAFLGFVVQPMSGALDFFSLTVDGIGASCSRCLEILNNKTTLLRIRNPRAIHADNILREYCEIEAVGQMILYLAEASRHFGCTEIFKEPSKFALSDFYEDHFLVPHQRIVLVTNKRVMLLQCLTPDKMDQKPSKIMWDVPWDELLALELAKAGCPRPSHLILHLKNFKRSEAFVRVIKCSAQEEPEGREPQSVRICSVVRKMWRAHQSGMKYLLLKVPSSQRHVCFPWSEADGKDPFNQNKVVIKSRELYAPASAPNERRFLKRIINFTKVWSSEQELKGRCTLCRRQVLEDGGICSIWRPVCPDGYISIGDIAHVGSHPPNVAAVYQNSDKLFTLPVGYDLVWRNCLDDYTSPISIWHPRAPDGYASLGCVAVPSFTEPEPNTIYCVAESLAEETVFEEQKIWSAPDSYPWACHIYQVRSDALHFVALRQPREESDWKPMRVLEDPQPSALTLESQ